MSSSSASTISSQNPPDWSLKHPYVAKLKARRALNGAGSAKNTQHLEVAIGTNGPLHNPGDSLGVLARNCPDLVNAIITTLGATGDEIVVDGHGVESSFRDVLMERDIAKVAKPLLHAYADAGVDPELSELFSPERKDDLAAYRSGRDLLDIVTQWPNALSPAQIAEKLAKLTPRLYSIASSRAAHPGEIHLTVGVVHFEARGRQRKGVCSTYLGERVEISGEMDCYVHHSKSFALPADPEVPVIMVGPGTGIAPFRAFLQERQAQGATGRNWLFFGDQHRATDYLYQDEFEAMQADGLLNRIDLAFSRDQTEKVYVQHKMNEASEELWAWLDAGAHFYVCGDALRMAKDVDSELLRIVSDIGGLGDDDAVEYVKQMKKAKRYQRDVYAV